MDMEKFLVRIYLNGIKNFIRERKFMNVVKVGMFLDRV